ncbi:hypothetical protein T4C_11937 [Trichinella pseudospiralis]|uniref:Uncharacterized protein n=1 Tax=Trichinella pseudospiralis TaxID=6337 RepID=A0A0V1J7F3_TRIPS|nr:hypothetical protein T4C_11937 [Trichinella pseudospiralis]
MFQRRCLLCSSQEWTKFNFVKIQFRLRRDEHITLIIKISLPVPSNNVNIFDRGLSTGQKESRHRKKTR